MDKKHIKKLKREAKKRKDKAAADNSQQRLTQQMNMFDRLPDACSACQEPFPKTREAHMTWQVMVWNAQQKVRLFCPPCQHKAKELAEGVRHDIDN